VASLQYGHHAKTCQAKTCCGKCAEPHETQNCKNTTVKCCQCKGSLEAWHYKCPIKLAKRKILRELRHQLPYKFVVPNRTSQKMEFKEEFKEEKEKESASSICNTKPPSSNSSSLKTFFDSDQGTGKRAQPNLALKPTRSSTCKGRNRPFRHSCTNLAQKTRPQSDHYNPTTGGEIFFAELLP
jgi:hypothetical protein